MTHVGVLGATLLGCATASHETRRDRASALHTPSTAIAIDPSIAPMQRTSDVLTAVELSTEAGLTNATLHEALVRLRPGFLNPREARTNMIAGRVSPAVFVDGAYWGGLEGLRGIQVSAVAAVQYVRPIDALYRFGPAYQAGVILVRLRR